jgi:hypothetical protein
MVDAEIPALLERLNAALVASGLPFKLALVTKDQLEFLTKNARFMPNRMFRNLVDNVKNDGGLSSLPFCWYDGTKYHVLSGNHRLKAGIEAGLTQFLVLYDDRPLSRKEQVARQLSHNSLSGQDDLVILKDLWSEIDEVGLKYYAGLDDLVLKNLEALSLPALQEVRLDVRAITLAFLPEEEAQLESALDSACERAKTADKIFVGRLSDFDRLLDVIVKRKGLKKIKSAATALASLLDDLEKLDGAADEAQP